MVSHSLRVLCFMLFGWWSVLVSWRSSGQDLPLASCASCLCRVISRNWKRRSLASLFIISTTCRAETVSAMLATDAGIVVSRNNEHCVHCINVASRHVKRSTKVQLKSITRAPHRLAGHRMYFALSYYSVKYKLTSILPSLRRM